MRKRVVAWLLCFCMFATLFSTAAFADSVNEYEVRFNFRSEYGMLFVATGANSPLEAGQPRSAGSERYLDGETLHILVDQEHQFDEWYYNQYGELREAEEPSEERSLYVYYRQLIEGGQWNEKTVVAAGEITSKGTALGMTFENGVLSFDVAEETELEFSWTKGEYDFNRFSPNGENPVMVYVDWWGRGEVNLPEGIDSENFMQYDNYYKILVDFDVESLTFTWDPGYQIRGICVDGLNDNETFPWEGDSYTLELNLKWSDESPRTHYNVSFDFEDGPEANGELIVDYDQGRGTVYYGMGASPEETEENYLVPGWENRYSFLTGEEADPYAEIFLRIDTGKCLDWDTYNESGEIQLWEDFPEPMEWVFVTARFERADHTLFDGLIVANGEAVPGIDEVTYEDGLLSIASASKTNVEISIFWSEEDYEFAVFEGTEEFPIVVDVNWWGRGTIGLPEGVAEENAVVASGRLKFRVADDVESVEFTWKEGYEIREIYVDGLNDNQFFPWEGDSYTLELNQMWDESRKRDRYNVTFSFEGEDIYENGMFCVNYDQFRGAVFAGLGAVPAAEPEAYVVENSEVSFVEDGEIKTVNLLIDPTQHIDFDQYVQDETIALVPTESSEEPSICVTARLLEEDGSFYSGPVLDDGVVVKDGFTYEEGVLSFTPTSKAWIELRVYWNHEDFEFDTFGPTEECPIVIEFESWGNGSVWVDDEAVDEENIFVQYNRGRVRVPADAESITFAWSEGRAPEEIYLDYREGSEYLEIPEEPFLTLNLDKTDWEGAPIDWYRIAFNFPNDGTALYPYQVQVNSYSQNGSIFYGLNAPAKTMDKEAYATGWGGLSYNAGTEEEPEIGTVYLTLDPTVSVNFYSMMLGEIEFLEIPTIPDYAPTIFVRFNGPEGEWIDKPVVMDGEAIEEGYSFADNVFAFKPETASGIEIQVYWSRAEYEYSQFHNTEEKPIILQVYSADHTPLSFDPALEPEDYYLCPMSEYNAYMIRLPEDQESIEITWPLDAEIGTVQVSGAGEDGEELTVEPESNSYTLMLDQTWGDQPCQMYSVSLFGKVDLSQNDYSELEAAVAEAKALNAADYTEDSFAPVAALLEIGETILSTRETAQPMVNAIAHALTRYMSELEKVAAENPFEDVPESAWYTEAVLWAVKNGITSGTDETHFSPNDKCTRAQVVQFLYAQAGEPEITGAENPFVDVKETNWYYNAVMWAVAEGITAGTDETHFSPNDTCTRAQVVQFLYAAAGEPEVTAAENPFTDVKETNWFYKAVMWAVENEITAGTTPTTFEPNATCIRSQIVQFMYNDAMSKEL